jgi:hypothetical protein
VTLSVIALFAESPQFPDWSMHCPTLKLNKLKRTLSTALKDPARPPTQDTTAPFSLIKHGWRLVHFFTVHIDFFKRTMDDFLIATIDRI